MRKTEKINEIIKELEELTIRIANLIDKLEELKYERDS